MASAVKMMPNWREQLGAKLVTPEEAVAHIKSGDRITASIAQATPFTLFHALAGRLMEIERVVINYSAALFAFDLPGLGERYRLESFYLSPIDRKLYHDGVGEFVPVSYYRAGHLPPGLEGFNVYLMTVSPPDAKGEVNFGDLQIMSKLCAREADLVIAEVDPCSIRVGGDNSMHMSEIDYFVERTVGMPEIKVPPVSEEERRTVDTIGAALPIAVPVAAVPTIDEAAEDSTAAAMRVATAQASNPWAVSRKCASLSVASSHFARMRPAI